MEYKIISSRKEDIEKIHRGLIEYNKSKIPFEERMKAEDLNYVIKDKDGRVIAGIIGVDYSWKVIYIDVLWVDEEYRGKGLGTKLIRRLEEEVRAKEYTMIHLDTFDFQGKDFYMRNGYEVFGVLEDCPKGHKRYFMKKNLI